MAMSRASFLQRPAVENLGFHRPQPQMDAVVLEPDALPPDPVPDHRGKREQLLSGGHVPDVESVLGRRGGTSTDVTEQARAVRVEGGFEGTPLEPDQPVEPLPGIEIP